MSSVESISSWHVISDELRASPRETKRAVAGSLAGVTVVVLIAIIDAAMGSPGQEPFRLVAIVIAAVALQLRVVGSAVWEVGSRASPDRPPQVTTTLHRAMHIVPAINAVAAVLFGVAAGLVTPSILRSWFFATIGLGLVVVAAWTAREAIHGTAALYALANERARSAEQAAADAARARMAALQSQMNPHFLFNALNTVASLIRTDPRAAEQNVEQLATVLRATLARSERTVGTLGEEIDYLRTYLALESTRWGDALRVEWAVEPGALERAVPVLALQPLVENALVHGIGRRLDGGTLGIDARLAPDDGLRLAVSDDGPGLNGAAPDGTGLGNLRRRLETLYGNRASLRLERAGGVTVASISLPPTSALG